MYCGFFSVIEKKFALASEQDVRCLLFHIEKQHHAADTSSSTFGRRQSFFTESHPSRLNITKPQFVDLCQEYLGETRSVVLKFCQSKTCFENQIKMRNQFDRSVTNKYQHDYVVALLDSFPKGGAALGGNDDDLGPAVIANANDKFKAAIETSKYVQGFYGMLVTEGCDRDRNLQHIFSSESSDNEMVQNMAIQLAEALSYLHSENIIHGDVRLKKFLRVYSKDQRYGRIKIIDFDTASFIGGPTSPHSSHISCPPVNKPHIITSLLVFKTAPKNLDL